MVLPKDKMYCPTCQRSRTSNNLRSWECSHVDCPLKPYESKGYEGQYSETAYKEKWDGCYRAIPTDKS